MTAARRLDELLRAAGLPAGAPSVEVGGLATDSRSVEPGDLFCCVRGASFDGHDFAHDAVASGAVALLAEREVDAGVPLVLVGSVRAVLGPLADAFFGHPSKEMAVAGVTGTNGKTTVTFMLESVARAAGMEPGIVGTVVRRYRGAELAAPRSTPEAVDLQRLLREMADAKVDVVALEATSDGLEQGRLRGTTMRSVAFTNLSPDHLNTHGTMEAYFEAKASLFDGSYADRAVVNSADAWGRRIVERAAGRLDVLTYEGEGADIRCELAELHARGSRARFATPAGPYDVEMHLIGRHNVSNAMCAFGVALQLGIGPDAIVSGIAGLERVAGRLERIECGQSFTVVVDYAHTPDALEQVLRSFRDLSSGRVIVVFGCGGDRDRSKRPLMGEAATSVADLAIVTSDNPRTEEPLAIIEDIRPGAERGGGEYRVVPDRREAIAEALRSASRGDVVVVAGKGHEQGQTFATETIPFDDRDVTRELLEEIACRA